VRALRGSTRKFGCFDDEHFDEPGFERRVSSNPDLARAECWYWIRKAQARFFAGDYAAAVDASAKAQGLLWTSLSLLETADYCFYGSLSHAASCDSATAEARQRHVEALASLYAQLRVWAEHRPENFEQRAALVCAEIARLDGRDLEAMRLYEHAIRSAGANGFIHDEALANEVAARFYAARGFGQIAALYLRNARHGYLSWGADGKVRQLDQLYPQLHKEEPSPDARGTIGATVEHLELATVLKVSQAVSGEIVLENLVETLLRTAIEHAGAERGLVILPRGGELLIQAEANTGGNSVTVLVHETPVGAARLPESVVRYAARTQESVILDDAWAHNPFSTDEYIRARRARSALCLPLVKQGALVALLYLENNLAPNVFTPGRIAVLKVLASGAAMALENSRLYRELQEREAKIRRLVDANIVGVSIWTFEGRILEANDAFLDIVGYAREDLASGRLRWTELTPPEWDAASERSLAQIRTTGRADLFEKEYVRKDGSRVPILLTSAAIDRSSNVAFVLDLTERKRTEAALQRAQTELAHISRVMTLGELTSSIAHEINQPIAAMVTSAGSALRWLGAPQPELDKARRSLERIAKDGRRASEILNRIRALVKRQPSRKEPLDINAAILEVIALTRDPVRTNDIALESRLAPGLPRVHGDRVQLEQVILNLIVNAVEAMAAIADHRRRLAIASLRDAAGGVRVEVRDSGTGLDPDRAEKLFEPFYTTKAQGLGVGLAISRSIIEDHGGKLWATANVPRGAVFQFSLPLGEAQA
jgi:PAS domain S-box-containing protein